MSEEPFVIYRQTTLGKGLDSTLTKMQEDNEIREDLADKIKKEFDKVVANQFKELPDNQVFQLKGQCKTYNHCDDVWKFILNRCEI